MSVSGPAPRSPLEVWLHQTESGEPAATSAHTGVDPATPVTEPGIAPRDSAEGLLDLDVWGAGADRHPLVAVESAAIATPTGTGASGVSLAQAWAEHIFLPLE